MSMNCPKCDHKGTCLNSRRKQDGSVSRTYKCLSCPRRWSTTEHIVTQGHGPRKPKDNPGIPLAEIERRRVQKEVLTGMQRDFRKLLGFKR